MAPSSSTATPPMAHKVLVFGATGATGKHVVRKLLDRGDTTVVAVARSKEKMVGLLKKDADKEEDETNENLVVEELALTDLSPKNFDELTEGCSAVVSCLGHNPSFQGMFRSGYFVSDAAKSLTKRIESNRIESNRIESRLIQNNKPDRILCCAKTDSCQNSFRRSCSCISNNFLFSHPIDRAPPPFPIPTPVPNQQLLGHNPSFQGMFRSGYFVSDAAKSLTKSIASGYDKKKGKKCRLVWMGSDGVVHPDGTTDPRRSAFERGLIGLFRWLLPPVSDNEMAAEHLYQNAKKEDGDETVDWCVVRPGDLFDADTDEGDNRYETFDHTHGSLFGGDTCVARIDVADFMADLATMESATYGKTYNHKMPVIYKTGSKPAEAK
eukprot:CAMPEP_0201251800 /NCGR_PEP_ID=MMETSP0852-20130820/66544_1 /ASSEMBLY_ACC=CAM_ASM_000632 /TAXON_ID=183588 /ORGANISM="Pseudo-nitzschia fraudulenta, Strain WWA7" /LENGTH=380 /DNA_ID=CAMNT_0047551419 /DNA_START=196 /DNA_END=1339 /DNA_ORIENTATION=-